MLSYSRRFILADKRLNYPPRNAPYPENTKKNPRSEERGFHRFVFAIPLSQEIREQ